MTKKHDTIWLETVDYTNNEAVRQISALDNLSGSTLKFHKNGSMESAVRKFVQLAGIFCLQRRMCVECNQLLDKYIQDMRAAKREHAYSIYR